MGGAAPESLIEAEAVLVAGDETSGFYRAKHILRRGERNDAHEHRTQADNRMAVREAYSWGGLTSGGGFLARLKKSLWVVLLPYSLVNVAGWMAPPVGETRAEKWDRTERDHPGSNGLRSRILRLLGLWMTLVFGLWLAAIFIDMAALQCGAVDDCAGGRFWLKWLKWDFFQFIQGRPVALMTVGLVAPLLGLGAIWRIGVISQRSSEGRLYAVSKEPEEDGEEREENLSIRDITGEGMTDTELARDDLWHSKHRVAALLRAHIASTLGAIATVFAFTVYWLEDQQGDNTVLFLVLMFVALAFTLVVAGYGALPGGSRSRKRTWGLLVASLALLVVVAALGWIIGPEFSEIGGTIRGRSTLIQIRDRFNIGALMLGILPIVAMLLWLSWLVWKAPYPKKGEKKDRTKMGQAVAAALGVVSGTPVLVGGGLWRGDSLQDVNVSRFYRAGAVALLIIGVLLVPLLLFNGNILRKAKRDKVALADISEEMWREIIACGTIERARVRFPEELGDTSDGEIREGWEAHEQFIGWRRSLLGTRLTVQWGRNRAMWMAIIVVVVMLLLAIWASGEIATGGDAGFQDRLTRWSWLVTVGKWSVLALFAVLLRLVYRSYQVEETRRSVAKAWDILTFWPRWFHPLAPPSYAASALPQLRTHLRRRHRLQWPAEPGADDNNRVLISAHSQGTVLAVAAVARLDDKTRSRISLLTYGSPVRSLYAWFFPRFFNRAEMVQIAKALGGPAEAQPGDPDDMKYARWRNLRRCTDPIAGTIFVEGDERGNENCHLLTKGMTPEPDGSIRLNQVDWIVPDPFPELPPAGDPMPGTKGHSNYDVDPPFESARCELFGELGVSLVEVGCEPEPPMP